MSMPSALVLAVSLLAATSLGAAGFDLSITNVSAPPAVAGDGGGFLAAWIEPENGGANYAAVVRAFTRSGPSGAGSVRLGRAYYGSVGIALGSGAYLVVWTDGGGNVTGSLVTPSGDAAAPFVLGRGVNPSVAWNGSEFFVVWSAERTSPIGTTKRIYGVPVSSFGIVRGTARQIGPEPQPRAGRPADEQFFITPRIVWTGREYFVVWRGDFAILNCTATCVPPQPSYLLMTHVAADGTPSEDQPKPLIAPAGDAVWSARAAASDSTVAVAVDVDDRVDLFVVQPDLTFSRRTLFQWAFFIWYADPAPSDIAFDGTSYVAAWRPRDGVRSWLETARLAADGSETVSARHSIPIVDTANFVIDPTPSAVGAAVVISEKDRIRAYFADDLPDAPLPPRPPRNLVAQGLNLTWSGGDGGHAPLLLRPGGHPRLQRRRADRSRQSTASCRAPLSAMISPRS